MLETGWDILFFWVSRMILLTLKLTGKVPSRKFLPLFGQRRSGQKDVQVLG